MTKTAVPRRIRSSDARFALAFFGLTTASLVVFDLFVGQILDVSETASWAYARALIMAGSAFAIRGIDQALVRRQVNFEALWRPLVIQLLLLSSITILPAMIVLGGRTAVLVYVSTACLGFLQGVGGYLRSDYRMSHSILAINGWKTLLVLAGIATLLVFGDFPPVVLATVVLVISVCAVWALVASARATVSDSIYEFNDITGIANHLWLTTMVALGFLYVDQLILNLDGETHASARLFLYSSILWPLPMFVAGFTANLMNPWLRSKGEDLRASWRPLLMLYTGISMITVLVAAIAGFMLGHVLGRFDTGIDIPLVAALSAVSFARLLYVPASGVVGVFGSGGELKVVAAAGAFSVGLTVGIYFMLSRGFDVDAAMALVLALLSGILTRVTVSFWLTFRAVEDTDRSLEVDALGAVSR